MKQTFMCALIIMLGLTAAVCAQEQDIKRVFIVASYEDGHVCGGPQEEGVLQGLNKEGWFEGMNMIVERYYMDTKRVHTTPEAMRKQGAIAIDAIHDFMPDVIITIDDNAFREVGLAFAGRDDVAVVFAGMNGQPETYNTIKAFMETREMPGHNVTGVYEKLYMGRSVKVMSSAVSGLKGHTVVGITDFSPTGNAITKQFELEKGDMPADVTWALRRVKDWQEYTDLIKELNADDEVQAIYPVALSLKVSDTVTYTAPQIFGWTIENSTKPEMALNYFFSKIGLFGGAAVDFQTMGFVAGKQAGAILSGVNAGTMAIEDAPEYAIVFNIKRAKQLGITIPMPLLTAADYVYKE